MIASVLLASVLLASVSITSGFLDVPVNPDAPTARDWIIRELAKPEYQAAKPTWFDRLSSAFWDWINSLKFGDGVATQGPLLAIALAVVVAAIVAAFLIFGPPRLGRRSVVTGVLFGEDDRRTAVDIRKAAEDAASRGEWTVAIEEMFRSIARGLAERTIVTTNPGSTARDFAARAGTRLPTFADALSAAAVAFDEVRYLGRDGQEETYRLSASLELDLRSAKPALAATIGAPQ
ncbi:DUF4129 domain-containing protein [Glaciihabitans sp. UYNi722]|uniref:DUF4129 domain-containing protein n=1 Tax=Glaciihabitans sp. UYNi722 TaxID=3156344 RepID=UPI00339A4B98